MLKLFHVNTLDELVLKVLPETVYDKDAFNYDNHKISEPLTEK